MKILLNGYQLLPSRSARQWEGGGLIAAGFRATSVPACGVAAERRPSLGVGQSRPAAPAIAQRWAAAGSHMPMPARSGSSVQAAGPGEALLALLLISGGCQLAQSICRPLTALICRPVVGDSESI